MSNQNDNSARLGQFGSTRWSVVLEAAHHSSPDSRRALETLCLTYWYPLYAYVRRRGYDLHEAQDLTQEFFARLVEKDVVDAADPSRGRFRSFLLTSLSNFLANEWDKQHAQKRGGDHLVIPLDFGAGDSRYSNEPASGLTPERLFDREWAISLLDHVMAQLRQEFIDTGKKPQFDCLKEFIAGRNPNTSFADAAQTLGISESAAMTAASRLRKRYRALLWAEIANTLADPSETEDELRSIVKILSE